jgi:hypothetical protein
MSLFQIKRFVVGRSVFGAAILAACLGSPGVFAVELDWSGQFRAENHFVSGYVSSSVDQGGYGVLSGGADSAHFQPLFLRLNPKLVVNDNVYLKTEWWVGDPVFGMFGNAAPFSPDQRQFYSNQSRGSAISAQRFWADVQTDFGLVQVGRMPLHYGLGVVWNAGDGMFDRYQTTGDGVRYVAKLGSLTFAPAIIKYSLGNTIGGSCAVNGTGVACARTPGRGNVTDFSASLRYEVPEEDLEVSVNLIRHVIGGSQDAGSGFLGVGPRPPVLPAAQNAAGSAMTTYDIFARKKLGKFTFAGEVPIVSGDVAGISRSTVAIATELSYQASDRFSLLLKAGRAPGEGGYATGSAPASMNAFFFNPSYRLGLILFNYALHRFAGLSSLNNPGASPAALASPFDNPVVNASYAALSGAIRWDKWTLRPGVVLASADQAARAGFDFFNTNTRTFVTNQAGKNQGSYLGTEFDLGVDFRFDDAFTVGMDTALFLPGSFYAFANAASDNSTSAVFANVLRVSVAF